MNRKVATPDIIETHAFTKEQRQANKRTHAETTCTTLRAAAKATVTATGTATATQQQPQQQQ